MTATFRKLHLPLLRSTRLLGLRLQCDDTCVACLFERDGKSMQPKLGSDSAQFVAEQAVDQPVAERRRLEPASLNAVLRVTSAVRVLAARGKRFVIQTFALAVSLPSRSTIAPRTSPAPARPEAKSAVTIARHAMPIARTPPIRAGLARHKTSGPKKPPPI
jgi:hypothetical protein